MSLSVDVIVGKDWKTFLNDTKATIESLLQKGKRIIDISIAGKFSWCSAIWSEDAGTRPKLTTVNLSEINANATEAWPGFLKRVQGIAAPIPPDSLLGITHVDGTVIASAVIWTVS